MYEGDDLPIGEWDRNTAVDRVVLAKDRAGKHARALADPARVGEDVVLEAKPSALIKDRELRRAVGEVEGVSVSDAGGRTPVWILAAHKVAPVEVVVGVKLVACLSALSDSSVKGPWITAS
jgi:hypothetical protein